MIRICCYKRALRYDRYASTQQIKYINLIFTDFNIHRKLIKAVEERVAIVGHKFWVLSNLPPTGDIIFWSRLSVHTAFREIKYCTAHHELDCRVMFNLDRLSLLFMYSGHAFGMFGL